MSCVKLGRRYALGGMGYRVLKLLTLFLNNKVL